MFTEIAVQYTCTITLYIHALCLSREVEVACCRSGVGVLAVLKREDAVCSGCRGVAMASSNR